MGDDMDAPKVQEATWIRIQSSENSGGVDGYVFNAYPDGHLEVGYYQNNSKAIKEDVIWAGTFWKFKYEGPNGTYLRGNDEAIVKRGPYK